jgi:Na+-translocating ferredoxin:NAD+ oxidoreductase subunit B
LTRPAALPLFERLNAALPQTQCTRCGYPDCAAYAQAIAGGMAPINQCPPGGADGIARLAAIIGQTALPLNPQNGVEAPRSVAVIDEAWCIGCTLCLPVCPTDAIFGSNKAMHSIIEPHCTGCALCLPVCPVDCISLEVVTGQQTGWAAWTDTQAKEARQRYELRLARSGPGRSGKSSRSTEPAGLDKEAQSETVQKAASRLDPIPVQRDDEPALRPCQEADKSQPSTPSEAERRKRAVIDAALARARALRQS